MLPKWAWSGSREQFVHCGLRKFRHSKSSVDRWYTQFDRRRFVCDTWDNGSRLDRVVVECTLSITHCLQLNLQLYTIDLVRTCRISSFCTVAWQLARFQLTRRIARSLGDSWACCLMLLVRSTYDSDLRRAKFFRKPIHEHYIRRSYDFVGELYLRKALRLSLRRSWLQHYRKIIVRVW